MLEPQARRRGHHRGRDLRRVVEVEEERVHARDRRGRRIEVASALDRERRAARSSRARGRGRRGRGRGGEVRRREEPSPRPRRLVDERRRPPRPAAARARTSAPRRLRERPEPLPATLLRAPLPRHPRPPLSSRSAASSCSRSFKTPTLGLDLQGGLEVVLEAKAPRGREVTQRTSTARSRSSRSASTRPASPSRDPQQGDNQISVELAGRPRRRARRRAGRPDRAARVLRPRRATRSARRRRANGGSRRAAAPAAPLEPAGARREGDADAPGTCTRATRSAWPARPTPGGDPQQLGGKAPEGSKFYAVPEGRTILTCGPTATALSRRRRFPATRTTTTSSSTSRPTPRSRSRS